MVARSKTQDCEQDRASVDAFDTSLEAAVKQNVDSCDRAHGLFLARFFHGAGVLRRQLELAFENSQSRFTSRTSARSIPSTGRQPHSSQRCWTYSNQPFFEEKGQLNSAVKQAFSLPRAMKSIAH